MNDSDLQVALLVENTARGLGILGEHGLAWALARGGRRLLFDVGQGRVLGANAAHMGIPLAEVEAVVLSHGHCDHVGGLPALLALAPAVRIFLHPDAECRRFTGSSGAARRLSIDFMETGLGQLPEAQVLRSKVPTEVLPDVWMTGEIPRSNDFEDTGGPFYLDDRLTSPDPLWDDQALFFRGEEGVVVLLGCAHAGVVNTLEYIGRLTGSSQIAEVYGGMHLERASIRRMNETVKSLRRWGVRRLGPNHCTGAAALARFHQEFPAEIAGCSAGWTRTFRLRTLKSLTE